MNLKEKNEKNFFNFEEFKDQIINFSRKNRQFIFTYFDAEQDSYLTNHFKIDLENLPNLIVYDFNNRGYFIDNSRISNENLLDNLKNLIKKIEENSLTWSYGNFMQNFFSKFGLNFSEKTLILMLMCFFAFVLFFLIFSLFCCSDSEEITEELKREFMEKLAYNEDLNEEEKNMIVNSRNFNSFVRMGVEKIVEAIKGQRDENDNDDLNNNENEEESKISEENKRINEERKLNEDNLNSINDIISGDKKDDKLKKND